LVGVNRVFPRGHSNCSEPSTPHHTPRAFRPEGTSILEITYYYGFRPFSDQHQGETAETTLQSES